MDNTLERRSQAHIRGINEPVIDRYFTELNKGDFISVSEMFSPEGLLYPPFEKEICGRDLIASYLQSEAKGIKVLPEFGMLKDSGDGFNTYQVMGIVKTSFFCSQCLLAHPTQSSKGNYVG
ncbi:hypothetical protein [Altericista sp. CCNU0014]|uniref:hypothetical protein n=1 Tax=Altericista sp. CCNU0014 TaxID=3082949 RepID=UPI00384CD501